MYSMVSYGAVSVFFVAMYARLETKKKCTGLPCSLTDGYAMLMSPVRAKQLSTADTARVIWLCACVG